MTRRWLVRSVAAMVAAAWLMPALAAGQETASAPDATTLRTPWGDPDLQGIWSYATFTPLQRPADLAGREFLTPEEVAEQNLADATRASSERRDELSSDRDLALAYNQVWWDRGASTGRTSLIVDPPDGRLPPLTPAAERRQAAQREHRRVHPYDSWEDRPLQERCMTYQRVPPAPSGYSNTYQIFPGARAGRHSQRDDSRRARRAARRASAHRRAHPPVERRRARPLGRRHARGRNHALPRRHDVARVPGHPRPARGRAVHPHRRRHDRLPLHDPRRRRPTPAPSPWSCRSPVPPGYVIYEYACHEGNYSIANVLAGERAVEAAAKRAP